VADTPDSGGLEQLLYQWCGDVASGTGRGVYLPERGVEAAKAEGVWWTNGV